MIARRLRPVPLLLLTVVWILLWGTLSWWFVVTGLLVAALVLIVFPLPQITSGIRVHPLRVLVLVARFFADLVLASFQVAWKAVRPRGVSRGAIMTVTLTESDDLRRTIIAELTSLVPGTVVIDLDPQTGEMLMHVLDHADQAQLDAERRRVQALERRVCWALSADGPAPQAGAGESP